jgi:hypothetical protein
MNPTIDDFLKSSARWQGEHCGIAYELSWHGLSDYNREGIWCYYLMLRQEQFYAEDWDKLRLKREDREFAGNFRRHWNYEDFPDLEPHGGWTFGEMKIYLGKDGREFEFVKVGCDYAHHFDEQGGYWEGRADVERDAKRSIDLLNKLFPKRRERCDYTGRYGDPHEFYTARNGRRVLNTERDKFNDDHWPDWQPVEEVALADQ